MRTLTAGGFRDMSRLAAGSPAMHRDILLTNRDAIVRWIDAYSATLDELRATLQGTPEEASNQLTAFFDKARDARAEWATQTTREGELLQSTDSDLTPEKLSDQMGRMLLGGFARRRRDLLQRSPTSRDRGRGRPDS